MLHILNFRMLRAFRENFGENFRRERPKIVRSRSRKTRMKPSKIGNPLPKSQLDFESFSLRPLRYISIINLIQYNKKACCRQHFSPSASQSAVQRRVLCLNHPHTVQNGLHTKTDRRTKSCAAACGHSSDMICSVLAGALICDELVVHFLGDFPSHGKLGVLADGDVLE